MRMNLMLWLTIISSSAATIPQQAHVWHEVNMTTNFAAHCQVEHIYENRSLFYDEHNQSIETFVSNPYFGFGLYLLPDASFNMIYSVACFNISCAQYPMPCARVLFLISASGPAIPVVKIIRYWKGDGDVVFLSNNTIVLYVTF